MQRCSGLLVPISRQFGAGKAQQIQPVRNFFSRRRGGMVPAVWNPISEMEDAMKNMERHFNRMEDEFNSSFGLRPSSLLPTFIKPIRFSSSPMTMWESEVGGRYMMNVALGEGFKPENIKLSLGDGTITIEAKYDYTSEDGSSRVYQELKRQFTLPKGIDTAQLKSTFTEEGILQIEAPLPQIEAPKPKEIPIEGVGNKKVE